MTSWLGVLRQAGENATSVQGAFIGGVALNEIVSKDGKHVGVFMRREDAAFYVMARNLWPLVVEALQAAEDFIEAGDSAEEVDESWDRLVAALASLRAAVGDCA